VKYDKSNKVLVINDIHLPFEVEDALEFCLAMKKKWRTNIVVFTGDVFDNHKSSYHESDPDGMSAGDELRLAIKKLKKWHKAFPRAKVCIGNHDKLVGQVDHVVVALKVT